ncbi:precorrin-6A synthase (deacetylating) [Sphingomonas sp. 22176]|uniref:precorrin-6A synthase (deacetylating) n=1 Tax=Sphingomonas sp. 22176 TaxID=3453884 RepID=UPI003F853EB3
MIALQLIGIGTGSPAHLTGEAIAALNAADLILVPRKENAPDLADLRETICAAVLTRPMPIAAFDMPVRTGEDYLQAVHAWHDAIADAWRTTIAAHLPGGGSVALLVWGDPSLYDSTLRIAARLPEMTVRVVPGITSIHALTAAHAIPLNPLAGAVTITTGRLLRSHGWPAGAETLVVMLDGGCAFETLDPADITIWWGAYLGMPQQALDHGPLGEAGPRIAAIRADLRTRHGWIMDVYLLRKAPQ